MVNPTSGRGRSQTHLAEVVGVLRDADLVLELLLSRSAAEARSMTCAAVAGGTDVLVVMGGDGMVHLGLNACASGKTGGRAPTPLGVIPAGTGNDYARAIGLDPADPVAAATLIAAGQWRAVDVAQVDVAQVDIAQVYDRVVAGVVATGFDALVNGRANEMRWPKGSLRYATAALSELAGFSPLGYRLTIDGRRRDLEAMLVAVGNTTSYGGGMRICPDADPTDGELDVTIVHPVSRAKLLQLLPLMYSGRFARDPCVEQLRCRTVVVDGPTIVGFGDGEPLAPLPLTISLRADQPVFGLV